MKKFIGILFAVAALIILPSTALLQVRAQGTEDNTIENGVYIGEINVSGMTREEALAKVNEYINQIGNVSVSLNALNGNYVTVTADDIGLTWTNANVIDEALELGKGGNVVARYKALKDLEHENTVLPLQFMVDRQSILTIIEEQCDKFNVEAVDASLSREDGQFVIKEGQTGVVINNEASADAVVEYMTNSWDCKNTSIDLVVETDMPRGSVEELSKVKDVLGSFTTDFSTSGENRSGNVTNGCKHINGATLYPGDEFSVYNAVSPFTEENGYYMAGSYSNGLVVESLGGGICQVSTTLYNAVLRAELDVKQRSNHSMIVSYVDPSADAAISGTQKDFKFVNNLENPIYIEGYTSGKKITFNIYGVETRPSNRKVRFESETLEKIVPEGEKVVADSSKPAGYISVQSAHVGYKAQLWKIVTVDGEEVSREVVNSSVYNPAPRTAAVGTQTDDPGAKAAIQAAIATQSIDYVRAVLAGDVAAMQAQQAALNAQQAADPAAPQ